MEEKYERANAHVVVRVREPDESDRHEVVDVHHHIVLKTEQEEKNKEEKGEWMYTITHSYKQKKVVDIHHHIVLKIESHSPRMIMKTMVEIHHHIVLKRRISEKVFLCVGR